MRHIISRLSSVILSTIALLFFLIPPSSAQDILATKRGIVKLMKAVHEREMVALGGDYWWMPLTSRYDTIYNRTTTWRRWTSDNPYEYDTIDRDPPLDWLDGENYPLNIQYIIDLYNATRNLVGSYYKYDPFGVIIDHDRNVTKNLYTYTGRPYIADAGMYHLRNRTYFPGLGRFGQIDPLLHQPSRTTQTLQPFTRANTCQTCGTNSIIQSIPISKVSQNISNLFEHPYVYSSNNPVDFIDPFGLQKCLPLEIHYGTDPVMHSINWGSVVNVFKTSVKIPTKAMAGLAPVTGEQTINGHQVYKVNIKRSDTNLGLFFRNMLGVTIGQSSVLYYVQINRWISDKFATFNSSIITTVYSNIATHELGHAAGHTNPKHTGVPDDLMYKDATAPLWGTTVLLFSSSSANQIRKELQWPELY